MKTKDLIKKTLSRAQLNEMKKLTVANLGFKMLNIFSKHIGAENAISRAALFRKIFGRGEEITLADDLRWEYVKRGMHLLRQRTKCFVGSKHENGTWKYFVIRNLTDAQFYIDTLNRNISRMRSMQRRAVQAANQKWYQLDWVETSFAKKLLK